MIASLNKEISAPLDNKIPLVGAIRWDAWFPGNTYPGFVDPLLYTDYNYREPFYGWYDACVPGHAEIMDREIQYAADAKLDFWAFVWYPADCEHEGIRKITHCLDDYMNSEKHQLVKFAFILQTGWVAGKGREKWRNEYVPEFINKMRDGQYVKVEGNRPLLFWMDTADLSSPEKGFGPGWKEELQYLSEQAAAAGLGAPFISDMRHNYKSAVEHGFDGVSDYGPSSVPMKGHHTFSDLARHDMNKMDCSHGLKVLPGLSAVIDPQPRDCGNFTKDAGFSYGFSFELPTYMEWLNHLRYTFEWMKKNPYKTSNPPVTVIYAWNEIDEGGPGIVPSKQEGTMFLDAIRAVKTGEYPSSVINNINNPIRL